MEAAAGAPGQLFWWWPLGGQRCGARGQTHLLLPRVRPSAPTSPVQHLGAPWPLTPVAPLQCGLNQPRGLPGCTPRDPSQPPLSPYMTLDPHLDHGDISVLGLFPLTQSLETPDPFRTTCSLHSHPPIACPGGALDGWALIQLWGQTSLFLLVKLSSKNRQTRILLNPNCRTMTMGTGHTHWRGHAGTLEKRGDLPPWLWGSRGAGREARLAEGRPEHKDT